MTFLAKFMRVTTAAMTGIVARLVKQGFALRTYDAKDRRIIKIKLTARGEDLVRKINQQRQKTLIKIFGKLSAVDRQEYLRILKQVCHILTEEEV